VRTEQEIALILDGLDHATADAAEAQDLDFKRWVREDRRKARELVVEMAVCMANGGGGTVVFGVEDKAMGRKKAIRGVPTDLDIDALRELVHRTTDPTPRVVFEEMEVPEGTGRLLVMQVYGGDPPYTEASGAAKVRVGKTCQPLTGTHRRTMLGAIGAADVSAQSIPGDPTDVLSPAAVERLRDSARPEGVPDELVALDDIEFLKSLGVVRGGSITIAGLLLAGRTTAIREHVPGYRWAYLRMRSDTDYEEVAGGSDALPLALDAMTRAIMTSNPIETIEHGLQHFEYRTYPEIALREALMNAFCHRDLRIAGPTMVKQYVSAVEISNPGGFVGGVSRSNILHHPPIARNGMLVEALTRLRLVNRSNLGMSRMFKAMLIEGKEPPRIDEAGGAVVVSFRAMRFSRAFREFVANEERAGRRLSVDELLILHTIANRGEISTSVASAVCQRSEEAIREILDEMTGRKYVSATGIPPWVVWVLENRLEQALAPRDPEAQRQRVLRMLQERAQQGAPGMTNAEVRRMTGLDRAQVNRLIHELESEGVAITGHGRGARYVLAQRSTAPGQ
jgi:ATP-dependent DNA helicase RecG